MSHFNGLGLGEVQAGQCQHLGVCREWIYSQEYRWTTGRDISYGGTPQTSIPKAGQAREHLLLPAAASWQRFQLGSIEDLPPLIQDGIVLWDAGV